ncbi:hypothetical protein AVEN_37138-1 [Araneus ventricosus]|uniref:C2H2-type domain-containing protein n=1 Tax=Araneus ventricosus TaxID=182803 RepID=A0A4Y2WT83_ARAVE|nr:hypothetical protein AVEN_37138-1 [Araneus ventricosus]
MFPFKCPKCSRSSLPAGRPHCFHCNSDAATDTGMDDNFHPTLAAPRDTEVASLSRNRLVPNDMQAGSTVLAHNRKRSESNDRMITDNIQANKQSRQEICKKAGRNRDFVQETCAATNNRAFDNSHSVDIHHEFLNVVEYRSFNQGKQVLGNLSKKRPLTVSQNIASDTSILQSSQKCNAPGKISDSRVSIVKSVHSTDDILVDPGPSNFRGNENVPDLLGEKLQSGNPLERLSVVLRDEKTFTCRVCDEKIDKHVKKQENVGKELYECCVCRYNTSRKYDLQMHTCIHCPQKICNICTKEYTEGDSHDREHTCNV